ncbi:MAG: hypothetical protein U0793_07885 [Gemmataceae bacterium]
MRSSLWTVAWWLVTCGVAAGQASSLEIKHEGAVFALAWSTDGKRLASAGQGGVIRVTEFPSGKEVTQLKAGAVVTGLAFAPDGKKLGVKSGELDGPLSVWDLETGRKLKQLAFKGYACNQLAFTADGDTLLASGPGEHMVWNHVKGGGSGSKAGKVAEGTSAAVSPHGTIAAWMDPVGHVQMFLPQQRKFQRLTLKPTVAFAFSPDDRVLAAAEPDKTIRLWSVGGAELRKFEGLREPATLLQFAGNGKALAAASAADAIVRLWDVDSGRLRRRVTAGLGSKALALAPDGLTLALANGSRVQVWNVATRELGDLGPAKTLSSAELKTAWDDLASAEPAKAEAAFRQLASARQHALGFFKEQIGAIATPPIDWKRVDALLADLDHPTYGVRERASSELVKIGEFILPALEKYLARKPALEGERRAQKMITRFKDPVLTPERLRCLEAIEILEILKTPESIAVLEEIARDALLPTVRQAARDSVERLKRAKEGGT